MVSDQTIVVTKDNIHYFKTIEKRIMIIEEKHFKEIAKLVSCRLETVLEDGGILEVYNGTTGNSETFKLDTDNNWINFYKNKFSKLTEKETVLVKYVLREVDKSKYDLIVIETKSIE